MSDEQNSEPVYVIESIPVAGDNAVTAAEVKEESIPTPAHLRIFPDEVDEITQFCLAAVVA